ncbi:hypothetical protein BMETH_817_0 [methanotrophic bacterial endosymbiont of Bathymodiolus sp.]|nr:hypothetical protein BMETH_817_0 [methanotrophic bacterial endosymbiont of Bathymodiolus sp.]
MAIKSLAGFYRISQQSLTFLRRGALVGFSFLMASIPL